MASVDQSWRGLYRAGGACLLTAGILFLIDTGIFLILGPRPATGGQAVAMVASQGLLFRTANGILIVSGILFIPAVIALYLALKEIDKNSALVATGLAGIAIPISIGATAMNYSLTGVGDAAIAQYVLNVVAVGDAASVITFSVAVLILGTIMHKGVFGSGIAYLSGLTGAIGVIGSIPIAGLALVGLISVVIFGVWFLTVGFKLLRLR